MFHFVQLLLIITAFSPTLSQHSRSKRLVGGNLIEIEKEPYLASLHSEKGYICGGSILSPRWILTAAHCLIIRMRVVVRIGSKYSFQDGHSYISRRLLINPLFDKKTHDYDVGLVDIGGDYLSLDQITTKVIELIDSESKIRDNTEVVVAGWGKVDDDGRQVDTLTEINQNTLDNDKCKPYYPELTERMICTRSGEKKTCQGDSGSPLVMVKGTKQIGIVSFGRKTKSSSCDHISVPSVFTNVSNPMIREWIELYTGI